MKSSRLATVVSLLYLVFFATSASAECAWVVWLTFIRYDTNAKVSRVSESPATSAQTKVECMALLKTCLQDKSTNETALFPGIRVISGHLADTYSTDIFNETGQKVETYIVTCLPDTVDPRGPKGK